MARPFILTILFAGAPIVLLASGGAPALGGIGAYRASVTWGLPLALGLAAVAARPGGLSSPAADLGRRAWLAPIALAAVVLDQIFLAAGHLTGMATFTFGDQGLSARPLLSALWGLPLCVAAGIFGWEWALRRTLLAAWMERLGQARAVVVVCAVGATLALPAILARPRIPDGPYLAAALGAALCREVAFTFLFLAGGGILVSGLYRGLLLYIEAFVVYDWFGTYFPAANYVSSDPAFYLVRFAAALLATAAVGVAARAGAGGGE